MLERPNQQMSLGLKKESEPTPNCERDKLDGGIGKYVSLAGRSGCYSEPKMDSKFSAESATQILEFTHYYLSCRQNYDDDGHEEIISLAERFGVMRQITDFMANIRGRNTVATFYGSPKSQPTRRAFLCTNRELLLVEMEYYSDWTAEAQANLEAYVAACEAELKRLKTGSF
jgi:hypothetical protein